MSTVAPTGGQTALGTPPVATPSAVVIEASETAQAAVVGNIVTGTVIGRDARGAVQLRTQNGVIVLHSNARLPPGATVTLQVQAVGAQLQAILLQVIGSSGRPLTVGVDPAFPHAPAVATPAAVGAQPAMVTVAEGATVTAIVLGPTRPAPPPAGAPQPPLSAAPAPASLGALPAGVAPPAPSAVPLPAVPPAATSAPGAPELAAAPAPGSAPPLQAQPAPAAMTAPAVPGASVPAPDTLPTAVPPVAAPAPAAQATPGAAAPLATTTPTAPPAALPPPAPRSAAVPVGTAATSIAATVVPPAFSGTERMPSAARGAPPGAAAAGSALAAAVIQSGSAPPAASLAYAATQAATNHLQPAARGATSSQPPVDALHLAAPVRGGLSVPLPPGSALEVRVVVTAELARQPTPPGHTPLPATIVGRTPTGQGIVDTPAGRLAVPLPPEFAAAPVGMRLTLDVVAWRAAVAVSAPATSRAIETAAARPVIDAVDAIARVTHGRVDPQEALPRPGPRLAQQLADMAAALVTGDVAEWLGKPAVEALERRGQGELVRRLEHDLYDAARAAPQTPDWRSLILPFVVGDTLRPLRLYVRQRHERTRDKLQGTRFVVECDHDEHGALQLDGLVHGKRIDLILRSHAQLADAMRGDLTALFGDACGVMGYAGTIEFQATPEFPAMPRAEPTTQHVGVLA